MANIIRDEFRNDSGGFLGVVTIDNRGDRHGVSVAPGDTVWLSEEEQIATANAPRSEADNPLTNGNLVLLTSGQEVKSRRPLRPVAVETPEPEPDTGPDAGPDAAPPPADPDAPPPEGEPEEGKLAEGEEVGTPEATTAAGRRRRKQAEAEVAA